MCAYLVVQATRLGVAENMMCMVQFLVLFQVTTYGRQTSYKCMKTKHYTWDQNKQLKCVMDEHAASIGQRRSCKVRVLGYKPLSGWSSTASRRNCRLISAWEASVCTPNTSYNRLCLQCWLLSGNGPMLAPKANIQQVLYPR